MLQKLAIDWQWDQFFIKRTNLKSILSQDLYDLEWAYP